MIGTAKYRVQGSCRMQIHLGIVLCDGGLLQDYFPSNAKCFNRAPQVRRS